MLQSRKHSHPVWRMSSWALGILFLLELLEPILLPVSLHKPRLSVAAVQARWIYLCALTEVYARAHCWHTDQPITARQEPHSDQWEVHKHIHRTSVLWEITAAGDKEQIQFERLRIISKICDGLTHTSPPTSAQTPPELCLSKPFTSISWSGVAHKALICTARRNSYLVGFCWPVTKT